MALTPAIVRRLSDHHSIVVSPGAGEAAGFADDDYVEAGAAIGSDAYDTDLVTTITVTDEVAAALRDGGAVLGLAEPLEHPKRISNLAERNVTVLAFELLPRSTRAQSMDVLSSQATVLGYQAVLEAAARLPKFFPMLTTAAGTIRPAKVLVLGAGVAGLQAIATARRLGAVVSAYDVRAAAAEQVESLGAKFITLGLGQQDAAASGGYARALTDEDQARLLDELEVHVAAADAVITTAAIPGRRAPILVTRSMIQALSPGSIVIDGAASTGGNCELTVPGEVIDHDGVTIVGFTDLPARTATHASEMFARNAFEFLQLAAPEGTLELDFEDEIIDYVTVAHGGRVRHPRVLELLAESEGTDA